VKWKCEEVIFREIPFGAEASRSRVLSASVVWYPWGDRAVVVETTLIPPTDIWPDWHIRVHRIRIKEEVKTLHCAEGGFAISGRKRSDGRNLPVVDGIPPDAEVGFEAVMQGGHEALILSEAGASGLVSAVDSDVATPQSGVSVLKPDSNTNIACQRTLMPLAEYGFTKILQPNTEIRIVQGVFAVSASANGRQVSSEMSLRSRWLQRPQVQIDSKGELKIEGFSQ
jgi:hypothetical protein